MEQDIDYKILDNMCSVKELNEDQINQIVNDIYEKYFKNTISSKATVNDDNFKLFQNLKLMNSKEFEPSDDDIWIFGYGSLVWKADFPFIDNRNGFICGYQRHFYQHSLDHRGTPNKPGRVVTLTHTGVETDRVYGVAYRIAAKQKLDVLKHLDYREKNGYERCKLQFHVFPEDTEQNFEVIMYVATKENESYAGDVRLLPLIAEQIFTSSGPSGTNRDYLFSLANAMRKLFPGVNDEHLFNLELEVQKRIMNDEVDILEKVIKKELFSILTTNENLTSADQKYLLMHIESLRKNCQKNGWREYILAKQLEK